MMLLYKANNKLVQNLPHINFVGNVIKYSIKKKKPFLVQLQHKSVGYIFNIHHEHRFWVFMTQSISGRGKFDSKLTFWNILVSMFCFNIPCYAQTLRFNYWNIYHIVTKCVRKKQNLRHNPSPSNPPLKKRNKNIVIFFFFALILLLI